ncbi:MAG: galactose mutarotase, partial [Flavobacterium sp.]|nr:galactose mutarotase [Flavobacterium sp.]
MASAELYTIKNNIGMELEVSNYGATICSLKVLDKRGIPTNVVVGLDQMEDYFDNAYTEANLYLGSSIGRYAGRISKGGFTIENERYSVENTDGVHLHGGIGFDKKLWTLKNKTANSLILTYTSPHLEQGYPGALSVEVLFELNDENCLTIVYSATTTQASPVNLTCHPYINLNGHGTILEHELWINSSHHLEVDEK